MLILKRLINTTRSCLRKTLFMSAALAALSSQAGGSKANGPRESNPYSENQALVDTDMDEVYGRNPIGDTSNGELWLSSGLYQVGAARGTDTSMYMIVKRSVNDPTKTLAILFPKEAMQDSRSRFRGYMFEGRPIKNNSTIMLSPIKIDEFGNIVTVAESQRDAPVIEVVRRPGNHNYPLLLVPRNGALDGERETLGAKASYRRSPELKPYPSSGLFASGSRRSGSELIVRGNHLSYTNHSHSDNSYSLVQLNGTHGGFAGLIKSNLDTLAEIESENEEIKEIALFVSNCFKEEILIIGSPLIEEEGAFNFQIFSRAEAGLIESWFAGDEIHQ